MLATFDQKELTMQRNRLLASLPRADAGQMRDAGRCVPLEMKQPMGKPGQRQGHVLFPLQGYVSLLADAGDGHAMEVGMVGTEGMLGLGVALGVPVVSVRGLVQEGGWAWRIEAPRMRRLMLESAALRSVLDRYAYVSLAQLSQASACVRFHEIGPRLARWLLMCQDRSPAESFPMTQAFLSDMLGVRRVSVTLAAGALQSQGLIAYHRGVLRVLDRAGLMAASCTCYQQDCAVYARVFSKAAGRHAKAG
jgi:CRP-like cAMP-binding protein